MKVGLVLLLLLSFSLLKPFGDFTTHAQESVVETDALLGGENAASVSSETEPEYVNYELPYPGILPDNPFYFLKALRDNIIKMLINDDLKRTKFSLLNAEKRMFAAMLLIEKNKDELAVDTISKSNNYLINAIDALKRYTSSHPNSTDTKPLMLQIDTAIKKHIEVMSGIKPHIEGDNKSSFANEEKRLLRTQQNVKGLLNKH